MELFSVSRTVAWVLALAFASIVRAQSGALVQAWRYDPQKHLVEIRINNVSPKGITAFNMTVVMRHENGAQVVGEAGADFSTGIGSLPAETSYDTRLYLARAVTNLEAVIDVILYTDGSSEVQNKRAYDGIVARRKKLGEPRRKKRIDLGIALRNHSNDLRFVHLKRKRAGWRPKSGRGHE